MHHRTNTLQVHYLSAHALVGLVKDEQPITCTEQSAFSPRQSSLSIVANGALAVAILNLLLMAASARTLGLKLSSVGQLDACLLAFGSLRARLRESEGSHGHVCW